MSHFSVVVCIDDPAKLDAVMAPWDENLEAEPYRDYEEGGPAKYWGVKHFREKGSLNPDDATLTWAQVAEAHNRIWDDSEPMLVDDSGRAYQMSTANKNAKWDYWRVGGRWGGYFPFRAEHRDLVMKPSRGWDSPEVLMPDTCDGGPKLALDLAALREKKAAEARKTFAEWQELTEGTPDALPWSSFTENISEGTGYTIEQARAEYHSQPRVEAIKGSDRFRWMDDPIAAFSVGLRRYVAAETARAVPGFATVTTDGRWMAPGRMGWFAMSDDTEASRIGYWEAANAYIEALPETTFLIALDCHI